MQSTGPALVASALVTALLVTAPAFAQDTPAQPRRNFGGPRGPAVVSPDVQPDR
jgi:hypothetical protein